MTGSRLLIGLASLALAACSGGHMSGDEILEAYSGSDEQIELRTLEYVLENIESVDSISLSFSTAVAAKHGRFEDGIALMYISRQRHLVDLQEFPAIGKGGDSPSVLFGAMNFSAAPSIFPYIAADPESIHRARQRVLDWEPQIPTGYDPGWEYQGPGQSSDEDLDEIRKMSGDELAGLHRLAVMPEYQALISEYLALEQGRTGAPEESHFDRCRLIDRGKRFEREHNQNFAFHASMAICIEPDMDKQLEATL